jgi:hypothetical protein
MRVTDPAAIRANFITGMLPIRTGLTSVGRAGRRSGCRSRRPALQRAQFRFEITPVIRSLIKNPIFGK